MVQPETLILSSFDAIAALRPQWDALWARAGGRYAQSATACLAAGRRMLSPAGARLAVAAGFEAGELVALWPFWLRRQGFWRVLHQAGPLAAEASTVVVEPGRHADRRVAALWAAIGRSSIADLAIIPSVDQRTALGAVLAADRRSVAASPDIAPYMAWRDGETWDAYYQSLSAACRAMQGHKRRQLTERGHLRFEVVSDPARWPGLVAWVLREKRIGADRANERGAGLFSQAYESYLASLATEANSAAKFVTFLLMCGEEPVAARLAMVGPRHIDWIMAASAARTACLSVGTILDEHCLRFAMERGLTVEAGADEDENTRFWARNAAHKTLDYRVALTRWGAVAERTAQLGTGVRTGWRGVRAPVGASVGAPVGRGPGLGQANRTTVASDATVLGRAAARA